jgi:hypothetical protein
LSALNSYGSYFRLLLAASSQTTNVPPLSQSSLQPLRVVKSLQQPATGTPRVTSCQPKGGVMAVQLATDSGQSGRVRALNTSGVVMQTQPFTATNNSVVVNFSAKDLPSPVFFDAVKN